MTSNDLFYQPIMELSRLIESKKLSPVELVDTYLKRINQVEDTLNSFITVTPEEASAAAKEAEAAISRGDYRGPLHGIPVGLKDLFHTKGVLTTSGSKGMAGFVPKEDSTAAAKLKQAGAILLGKTNMNELALGATGENPHYGDSRNPWDPDRITGGSSGGSGGATAAGECAVALGSDTGGSVRIPAALCGLVGLKPTYGRVSLHGVTPLAWSLDHVGILARSVEDAGLVLRVIAGLDPLDQTSLDAPSPDLRQVLRRDVRSLRIGTPREHVWDVLAPSVREHVTSALEELRGLGATVEEVSLPLLSTNVDVSTTILGAEAAAAHGQLLKKRREQLDPRVRQRLEGGSKVSAADYIKAMRSRAALRAQVLEALHSVDLLAMPTCAIAASKLGAEEADVGDSLVSVLSALTRLTRLSNLTGFPSVTVPCGFSNDGLPSGLQLIGRPLDEVTVLQAAYAYEQATEWHERRPDL